MSRRATPRPGFSFRKTGKTLLSDGSGDEAKVSEKYYKTE
jgi:hypothetical protein